MPALDTYEVYLTSAPTMEVIADVDLAKDDIVFLSITPDGSRCRAYLASATTLALGGGQVLFQIHRPGNAAQTCEVSIYRAVAFAGAPGAVGDPLYLQDAGGLGVAPGTVSRKIAARTLNGYVFSGGSI